MGHRRMFFPHPKHPIWNVQMSGIFHTLILTIFWVTAAVGTHPMPYFDITLGSNNLPSSNFSFEIPSHNNFPCQWLQPDAAKLQGQAAIVTMVVRKLIGDTTTILFKLRASNNQLPTTNGTPSQMVNVDHSSYEHRTNPYRTASTHQPLVARTEAVALPRYSRPVPIIGRSSERNGRSRGLHDRITDPGQPHTQTMARPDGYLMHDFHSGCIKEWWSIKKVCPICKASALPATLKKK